MSATDTPTQPGTPDPPRRVYDPVTSTPTSYGRPEESDPPLDYPAYKSSRRRFPREPLVYLPHTLTEITGPALGSAQILGELDNDLTRQHADMPLGERMVVFGTVRDTEAKPLGDTLVEIWQANASGRYRHRLDNWAAPLDPNFSGAGRCVTDAEGRFSFTTVKPGAYPWGNHYNAWRPAHIHFSLMGRAFAQRLVTQMYFPGDPFFPFDPMYNSVRDLAARDRMVARFDIHRTVPNWAQAWEFDIVLRGPSPTPFEEEH